MYSLGFEGGGENQGKKIPRPRVLPFISGTLAVNSVADPDCGS